MKQVKDEKNKLKRVFADLSLENLALKDLIGNKALTTAESQEAVDHPLLFGMSVAKACFVWRLSRATFNRKPRYWCKADAEVIDDLNGRLEKAPQSVFWKCYTRLRLKGLSGSISELIGCLAFRG